VDERHGRRAWVDSEYRREGWVGVHLWVVSRVKKLIGHIF
jgi:hypothetical protein